MVKFESLFQVPILQSLNNICHLSLTAAINLVTFLQISRSSSTERSLDWWHSQLNSLFVFIQERGRIWNEPWLFEYKLNYGEHFSLILVHGMQVWYIDRSINHVKKMCQIAEIIRLTLFVQNIFMACGVDCVVYYNYCTILLKKTNLLHFGRISFFQFSFCNLICDG